MIRFEPPRPRRRPSLTPMIDVVFLLLVFFMLASQFGRAGAIALALGGAGGAAYEGPPRLVQVSKDSLALNGTIVAQDRLAAALVPLMGDIGDTIVLRPDAGADVQRVLDVVTLLRDAGLHQIVVVD